jgi:hypothetical protein
MNVVVKGRALNMYGVPISVTTAIMYDTEGDVMKYDDGRLRITTTKY